MDTVVKTLVCLLKAITDSDEELMDPDFAVSLLEESSGMLLKMKSNEKKEFKAAIQRIAAKENGATKKFFVEFLGNAGLEGR